jgi:hypothetical protein
MNPEPKMCRQCKHCMPYRARTLRLKYFMLEERSNSVRGYCKKYAHPIRNINYRDCATEKEKENG